MGACIEGNQISGGVRAATAYRVFSLWKTDGFVFKRHAIADVRLRRRHEMIFFNISKLLEIATSRFTTV